jgi:hypothetical protein
MALRKKQPELARTQLAELVGGVPAEVAFCK